MTLIWMFAFSWNYFVLGGVLTITADAEHPSAAIERFGGKDQLEAREDGKMVMRSGDRLPFVLKVTRPFEKMTVRFWNANVGSQTAILINTDKKDETMHSAGLYIGDQRLLKLAKDRTVTDQKGIGEEHPWNPIQKDNITIWQRASAPQYTSVDAFFDTEHDYSHIATLGVNMDTYIHRSKNYGNLLRNDGSAYRYSGTVRGSHTLVAIPCDGEITYRFHRKDVNAYAGPDTLTATIRRGIQPVTKITVFEDAGSSVGVNEGDEEVHVQGLADGTYAVELETTSDTYLTDIHSNCHPIVFASQMVLADGPSYAGIAPQSENTPGQFAWYGDELSAASIHEDALQTLTVDKQQPLAIRGTQQPSRIDVAYGAHTVSIPIRDVTLTYNGVLLASDGPMILPASTLAKELANVSDLTEYTAIVEARTQIQNGEGGTYVETVLGPGQFAQNAEQEIRGAIILRPGSLEGEEPFTFSRVEWILQKPPFRLQELPKRLWNKIVKR